MSSDTKNTKAFDWVELKVYDVHGYTKGRLVTVSSHPQGIPRSIGMRSGLAYDGVRGEENEHATLTVNKGVAKVTLSPIPSTLRRCHRAAFGGREVGTVLCQLTSPEDGSLVTSNPREATQVLLQHLQSEFGLEIKSSAELEFSILDHNTPKIFERHRGADSLAVLEKSQGVLIDLLQTMREIDVKVDSLLTKKGTGQFELTFDITKGIEAADMIAEFRNAAYLFLKSRGYHANFMPCISPDEDWFNGIHFNFSLWDSENRNLLVDPEDEKDLSLFGRYWLAGMVKHGPAMVAICSPTVNCYRRLNSSTTTSFSNWGKEGLHKRRVAFLVRNQPTGNVYIENRLPSGLCNPHLVLACTLAAGMDGVRRKMSLPGPMEESIRLPTSLEAALEALQSDKILTTALGPDMVDCFIQTKKKFEVDALKPLNTSSSDDSILLSKEKEFYLEFF